MHSAANEMVRNGQYRILVVDDNQTNRLTLYLGVRQLGHHAEAAGSGPEALERVATEPFDAVLLDLLMPEMNGYEVLRRLKSDESSRHIPVIVISAETDMESVANAIELGAEDFLPKPFNPIILRARLNASLEKKRYRDLERAYLEQELMLRQAEVLAALGKLAAGMAHELNNSVSAAQRGAERIQDLVDQSQALSGRLQSTGLSAEEEHLLAQHAERLRQTETDAIKLSPIERSERELAIEDTLRAAGINDPWSYASQLVDIAVTPDFVTDIMARYDASRATALIEWLGKSAELNAVVSDVRTSLSKVRDIVSALKAYAYMDQAPIQYIDVNEALESTLAVLQPSIPPDIEIRRDFGANMSHVEANGSQLSLVWTNILDNAVAAVGVAGTITIRTREEDGWVSVEIEDTGPGIAPEIEPHIFEPFFTTKPPGRGAGLGLSVSHTIIVQNHGGTIRMRSHPGATCFQVQLPVVAAH
ncbi:MAG: response regulator [Chloroflexota bacterium]